MVSLGQCGCRISSLMTIFGSGFCVLRDSIQAENGKEKQGRCEAASSSVSLF